MQQIHLVAAPHFRLSSDLAADFEVIYRYRYPLEPWFFRVCRQFCRIRRLMKLSCSSRYFNLEDFSSTVLKYKNWENKNQLWRIPCSVDTVRHTIWDRLLAPLHLNPLAEALGHQYACSQSRTTMMFGGYHELIYFQKRQVFLTG